LYFFRFPVSILGRMNDFLRTRVVFARMRRMRCFHIVVTGVLLLSLAACSQTTQRTFQVGSETTTADALTASAVAAQVEVIPREQDILFRAPTLRVGHAVTVARSGPVAGANLGTTQLGRSGFLLGIEQRDTGVIRHFAGYHSDFVEGKDRYKSVTANDQALSFSLATADQDPCPGGCKLTFQTLMIDVPDGLLRSVTDAGLTFTVTLDNGHQLTINAPAPYVRGYLQAIDAAAR
jgi:hypothetical protein